MDLVGTLKWVVSGSIGVCLLTFHVTVATIRSTLRCFLPQKYKDLTNDVILITGGGRGVGQALALEAAKLKPKKIILWGRHEDTLQATARRVRLFGTPCTYMTCNVGDREQVYEKARQVKESMGDVTILINNAGIMFPDKILEAEPEEVETTYKVNVLAHCWTLKAFLPSMIEKNNGHIVNINSMLGLLPTLPGAGSYASSKHALTGLWSSVIHDIEATGANNVHVTNVHPYLIDTEMFQGCHVRFPLLFPSLSREYVARKSIDAMRTNKKMLIMPRIMWLSWIAYSIFPADAIWILLAFCGVPQAMELYNQNHVK